MRRSMPDIRTRDDVLIVEAPTAAVALGEVTTRLGATARIVAVDKVLRGGIGGFFARELVQVTARPGAGQPEAVAAPADASVFAATGPPAGRHTSVAVLPEPATRLSPVERALENLEGQEPGSRSFGDALRDQLTSTGWPPHQGASGRAVVHEESPGRSINGAWLSRLSPEPDGSAVDAPPPQGHAGGVAGSSDPDQAFGWSVGALHRIGLPDDVVAAVERQDPTDDLSWVGAVGRALAHLCGPLPDGDFLLTGPRAGRLADVAGVDVCRSGDVPARGSVCAPASATPAGRRRLLAHGGDRWLHLVVGGARWRGLVMDDPQAISWVGDHMVGEAIRLCTTTGAVLGFGVAEHRSATPWRANPVDLAVVVRRLVVGP